MIISIAFILITWGVKQSDIALFFGSVLTVIGVALVAQWSLLSNMTSGIILFYNHKIKLYDYITILEGKDYVITGKVVEIGLFFITLENLESKIITIPNNLIIQKSIMILGKDHKPEESVKKESDEE